MTPDPTTPRPTDAETAARLAAIIESSDDAIVGKTLDGVITSWNPAAERMFGYTAAEVIGKSITIIIPPERLSEETEVLSRIRRGQSVDHFDTVRVGKSGRRVDISLTVSPVRNEAGQIIGVSKIARDVTDRKRGEAERARLLAEAQEAREVAEALNRSKDQFLAVLSHELRTPLSAIYGWARMMAAGSLDAAQMQRATDAIVRNAVAQLRLTEDLLDVSRIITGTMRLDVRPIDPTVVVDAALDTVRPAADAKNIRLHIAFDPEVGTITGAPDRLQQVVWNLLINAVKFTPKGGRIDVSVRRVHSRVEIAVTDTGEGMRPELLPYVFDRFRQGDSTTTRQHGGLGIGLALVRHLVDLHGGTVSATSEGPGRGSTFTVALPVAMTMPARSEPQAREHRPDAPRAAMPSLHGIRVLIVDDDRDGLDLVTTILAAAGAEVSTALSAAAALEFLRDGCPDVVVSDIEMPGEDGFALLGRIRALEAERGEGLPVIALTAYGSVEDRKRALAAGFNHHLAKPVEPAELALVVARLAAARRV